MGSDVVVRRTILRHSRTPGSERRRQDIAHDWPPRQKALWGMLRNRNRDVPINRLYKRLGLPETNDMRLKQQRLGAIITRINKNIEVTGRTIKPGIARHTYRNYPLSQFQ